MAVELDESQIPAIPSTTEGWEALTVGELRALIGHTLLGEGNPDRQDPATAAQLDQVAERLFAEPWDLTSTAKGRKLQMIEQASSWLPDLAMFTALILAQLYENISHRPAPWWERLPENLRGSSQAHVTVIHQGGVRVWREYIKPPAKWTYENVLTPGAQGVNNALKASAGIAPLALIGVGLYLGWKGRR